MLEQISFFVMLIMAIVVSLTPAKTPFQWMETFFHELSHGLAAILTLGWIKNIELEFNGAGVCYTYGGLRIIVLLAGYAGAVMWGCLIYIAGLALSTQGDVMLLQFFMGLLVIITLLWVRNLTTLIIMAIMFIIFWIPTYFLNTQIPAYAIEFYGIYIVRSAITAPLNLIDGKHVGDGADLADITLIFPEGVWIALWFIFALVVLFCMWQWTTPAHMRIFTDMPYVPWM